MSFSPSDYWWLSSAKIGLNFLVRFPEESRCGDTIIAGAYGENGNGGTDRGAAYVFCLQPYEIHVPLVFNNLW
jgi:hypothetical protein